MRNWKIHRIRPNLSARSKFYDESLASGLSVAVSSQIKFAVVACCGHLVRAGRRVVTFSFVSSSIIHRNMKLFQHWIKWKSLISWFLRLFIDKEISKLLILSYFPYRSIICKNRKFLLPIKTIRYDWCLNKTCFCNL
jgi:hypothetical protein